MVLKDAVPRAVTNRAKQLINENPSIIVHGDIPAINNLYNESVLQDVMLDVLGPHTVPINAQVRSPNLVSPIQA